MTALLIVAAWLAASVVVTSFLCRFIAAGRHNRGW